MRIMLKMVVMIVAIQTSSQVANAGAERPDSKLDRIDFAREVMPVFTRFGCNAGSCHGSAAGRGGFKLSLFGGNAEADYQAIVRQLGGRRINLARPEESLLLAKPTLFYDHGGGLLFDEDSEAAELLRQWIIQGVPADSTGQWIQVTFTPGSHLGETIDQPVALRATASDDRGRSVDVTRWTVFSAEDPSAVRIDYEATARVTRPGRHIIIARYLNYVEPIELIVPEGESAIDLSDEPRRNFIDDKILERLSLLRIPPSPIADDATFLRRVSLDLTGRLPSPVAVQRFLADPSRDKRRTLVDHLLDSEEFLTYWTLELAKLFRVRAPGGGANRDLTPASTYHIWLGDQLRQETGYDAIARAILTASGDTHEVGPANFYRSAMGPRAQAELASELFLGSRLRCANCHDHPLDRWTQDDYHGLAAIFAKVQGDRVITPALDGDVIHPATREPARARIPGESYLADSEDPREALADWLTDEANPYFAEVIVNRLWACLMGRGLVDPVDDFRSTNPATHPALLEALAKDFQDHGYQLAHTLRMIATSATYARQSVGIAANAFDDRFYSHQLVQDLDAEVLADAFTDVLGLPEAYGTNPLGTRAVSLIDPATASRSLEVLGRCDRVQSCETPRQRSSGLTQSLHLFNGPLLNARIGQEGGRLERMIASGSRPLEIIDTFYLAALGRHLSDRERRFWDGQVDDDRPAADQRAVLEDFVWGLLASSEFRTNN